MPKPTTAWDQVLGGALPCRLKWQTWGTALILQPCPSTGPTAWLAAAPQLHQPGSMAPPCGPVRMQPELSRTGAQQCQLGCRERWNNQPLKYKLSLREVPASPPAKGTGCLAWAAKSPRAHSPPQTKPGPSMHPAIRLKPTPWDKLRGCPLSQ